MAKHKAREEWINLFKEFEKTDKILKIFFDELTLKDTSLSKARRKSNRNLTSKINYVGSNLKINAKSENF